MSKVVLVYPTKICVNCSGLITKKSGESYKQWNSKKYCSPKCGATSPLHTNPFTIGRIVSEEVRKKISNKTKGRSYHGRNNGKVRTKETKEKISQSLIKQFKEGTRKKKDFPGNMKKENHWNWKGGITSQDDKERLRFRNEIQPLVLARDNYTCVLCGARGNLQVDHIKSWKDFVVLRFDMNNCRTLCMKCHYLITYGKAMPVGIKTWGHNFLYKERKVD